MGEGRRTHGGERAGHKMGRTWGVGDDQHAVGHDLGQRSRRKSGIWSLLQGSDRGRDCYS